MPASPLVSLLDMRTVIFTHVLLNVSAAIVMFFLWKDNRRRFSGLNFWMADYLLQTAAVLLVLLRGKAPDLVSMTLSNTLSVGGTLLLLIGLERFVRRPGRHWHNYAMLALFVSLHSYFVVAVPNLAARNILLMGGLLFLLAQCFWLLVWRADRRMREISREAAAVFACYVVVCLVRVATFASGTPAQDFFRSGTMDSLLMLALGVLVVVLTFTLFLIINRLLLDEAEEQAEAARAASGAKSRFLAHISHEVRTPMSAILGFSDILNETELTSEQRSALNTIRESSESLLVLLNDMLDVSAVEEGRLQVELKPFEALSLAEETLRLVRERAAAKALKLEVAQLPGAPAWVRGDPARVKQVLLNLLWNAVKFTEKGSVTLLLRPLVEAGRGPRLCFCVRDTGIGIAEADLERVFDRFAQLESPGARAQRGAGLGLGLSRELVRLMGGEMRIDSRPGAGSDFCFSLPAADPVADAVAEGKGALRPAVRRLSLLLVEDTETTRRLTETLLKRRGHAVKLAADGEIALEILGRENFDAVLLDLNLPGIDGFGVAAALRRSGLPGSAAPLVAFTANVMPGERERCLAAGMAGYLGKPFTDAALYAAVEAAAELKSGQGPKPGATACAPASELARAELLRRHEGDMVVAEETLKIFSEEAPGLLAVLKEAAAGADAAALARAAHALKSAAGTAGYEELRRLAGEAETAGKAGDLPGARAQAALLEKELAEVLGKASGKATGEAPGG